MMDKALQLSRHQTQMAAEVGRAMSAGMTVLFEAATDFAKANIEHQTAFAAAMTAAKSPEAVIESQRELFNHSLRSAGEMATQMAAAFAAAAKPFAVSSAQPMDAAAKSIVKAG